MRNNPLKLEIIGGDSFSVAIHFFNQNQPSDVTVSDDDRVVLSIHAHNEVVLAADAARDGDKWYCTLSGAQTTDLQVRSRGKEHFYHYCIHIYWADGKRYTPVYNAPIEILPCPDEPGGAAP